LTIKTRDEEAEFPGSREAWRFFGFWLEFNTIELGWRPADGPDA
jgi:hypothetical protein